MRNNIQNPGLDAKVSIAMNDAKYSTLPKRPKAELILNSVKPTSREIQAALDVLASRRIGNQKPTSLFAFSSPQKYDGIASSPGKTIASPALNDDVASQCNGMDDDDVDSVLNARISDFFDPISPINPRKETPRSKTHVTSVQLEGKDHQSSKNEFTVNGNSTTPHLQKLRERYQKEFQSRMSHEQELKTMESPREVMNDENLPSESTKSPSTEFEISGNISSISISEDGWENHNAEWNVVSESSELATAPEVTNDVLLSPDSSPPRTSPRILRSTHFCSPIIRPLTPLRTQNAMSSATASHDASPTSFTPISRKNVFPASPLRQFASSLRSPRSLDSQERESRLQNEPQMSGSRSTPLSHSSTTSMRSALRSSLTSRDSLGKTGLTNEVQIRGLGIPPGLEAIIRTRIKDLKYETATIQGNVLKQLQQYQKELKAMLGELFAAFHHMQGMASKAALEKMRRQFRDEMDALRKEHTKRMESQIEQIRKDHSAEMREVLEDTSLLHRKIEGLLAEKVDLEKIVQEKDDAAYRLRKVISRLQKENRIIQSSLELAHDEKTIVQQQAHQMQDALAEILGAIRVIVRLRPLLPQDLDATSQSGLRIYAAYREWKRREEQELLSPAQAVQDALHLDDFDTKTKAQQELAQASFFFDSVASFRLFLYTLGWSGPSDEFLHLYRTLLEHRSRYSDFAPSAGWTVGPVCVPGMQTQGNFRQQLFLMPEFSNPEVWGQSSSLKQWSSECLSQRMAKAGATRGEEFSFDSVVPPEAKEEQVFAEIQPLLDSCLRGSSATVLVYGASGSGKSHSLIGSNWRNTSVLHDELFMSMNAQTAAVRSQTTEPWEIETVLQNTALQNVSVGIPREAGLLPRSLLYLFLRILSLQPDTTESRKVQWIGLSVFELHMNTIKDLLLHSMEKMFRNESELPPYSFTNVYEKDVKEFVQRIKTSGLSKFYDSPSSRYSSMHDGNSDKNTRFPPLRQSSRNIPIAKPSNSPEGTCCRVEIPVTAQGYHFLVACLSQALQFRSEASTAINQHSSRSHAFFRLWIPRCSLGYDLSRLGIPLSARARGLRGQDMDSSKEITILQLVDLAGNERVKESRVSGAHLSEAAAVNQSLSALSECISALAKGQNHIPFRSSRLTRILEHSLSGVSRCVMILTVSNISAARNLTRSTLQFGAGIAGIRVKRPNESVLRKALEGQLKNAEYSPAESESLRQSLKKPKGVHP